MKFLEMVYGYSNFLLLIEKVLVNLNVQKKFPFPLACQFYYHNTFYNSS